MYETFCGSSKIEEIKNILVYDGAFVIENTGHSGGLAFIYKKEGSAHLISKSAHFIDVEVKLENKSPYCVTRYYGHVNHNHWRFSWQLLRTLVTQFMLPWWVLGDFNDLLSSSEKRGRVEHPSYLLNRF